MLKLLPVILILLVISGGLIYFRISSHSSVVSPQAPQVSEVPLEVPKAVPNESSIQPITQPSQNSSLDPRLKDVEGAVTELKLRVSTLEKATPAPAVTSSQKAPLYIPLGSGGQISDTNWANLNTFQISLDPASYSGYTSMQLEVNMRLNQPGGQVYARLYQSSSGSAVSSEISSTSTTSTVVTSAIFTIPSGAKNYLLQAKSKDGSQVFIDYARIKVNF